MSWVGINHGFASPGSKKNAGIRRTPWKIAQPENVRAIAVNSSGFISKNEAKK
jgi:hypothetical protein